MNFAISPDIAAVHFPPISEVKGWLAQRPITPELPLVDLCQAIPDYGPAPDLLALMHEKIDKPLTCKYSPDEGLPDVRQAIADWYVRRYTAGPHPDEICLTIGASQAFWLAMVVLCQTGDEVIVPLPAYFDHPMALASLGIRAVTVPFDPEAANLDLDAIARRITPRTRAILVVTPSNPTGAIRSADELAALYALARRHRIALVLDETYNAFVDGAPHALFADPDWSGTLVQIASFGKTFALTGYRAGALVAGRDFLHHALKAQDSMAVCAPRLTQHAIAYGCATLDRWVAEKRAMMRERHDTFCALFDRPENRYRCIASGAFFAWVRHPFTGRSGREIARHLVMDQHLICLPGEVFGPGLDGYLRLAFGNLPVEAIPPAIDRFCASSRQFAG